MQFRVDAIAALRDVALGPVDNRAPPNAPALGSACIVAAIPVGLNANYHITQDDVVYCM